MLEKIHWLGHTSFRIEGEQVIYIDRSVEGQGRRESGSHPDHAQPSRSLLSGGCGKNPEGWDRDRDRGRLRVESRRWTT